MDKNCEMCLLQHVKKCTFTSVKKVEIFMLFSVIYMDISC